MYWSRNCQDYSGKTEDSTPPTDIQQDKRTPHHFNQGCRYRFYSNLPDTFMGRLCKLYKCFKSTSFLSDRSIITVTISMSSQICQGSGSLLNTINYNYFTSLKQTKALVHAQRVCTVKSTISRQLFKTSKQKSIT